MEDSVLSFLKAEWKVSDAGSTQCWASSFSVILFYRCNAFIFMTLWVVFLECLIWLVVLAH
jgi:hypothetical protein